MPALPSPDVLVLARDFPPHSPSAGSCLRVVKLVEWLRVQGREPLVLHGVGTPRSHFGYADLLRDVQCMGIEDRFQHERLGTPDAWRQTGAAGPLRRRLEQLPYRRRKRWLVPDPGVLAHCDFVRAATAAIETHQIRDLIISSPPHSMQCIGLELKRHFGTRINWIADWRDGWHQRGVFRAQTRVGLGIAGWLERRICARADWMTCATAPIVNQLPVPFDRRDRVLCMMNGFDLRMHETTAHPRRQTPVLGHFGSLSDDAASFRDPRPLLRVLPTLADPVHLQLWGDMVLTDRDQFLAPPLVAVHAHVDHADAIRAMRGCDGLLVLHTQREGAEEIICTKTFDYVLAERPIICIAPPEALVCKMVHEHGWGYVANPADPDSIRSAIEAFARACRDDSTPTWKATDFRQYDRWQQFECLRTPLGL